MLERIDEKIRNLRNLRNCSGLDGGLYAKYAKQPGGGVGKSRRSTANQNNVTIKNYQFDPQFLTIPQGASVTWINQDSSSGLYGGSTSIQHQITSDNSTFAQSAPLNNGDTYTVQFNQTGTFPYHCAIHTYMTGTITVVTKNVITTAAVM